METYSMLTSPAAQVESIWPVAVPARAVVESSHLTWWSRPSESRYAKTTARTGSPDTVQSMAMVSPTVPVAAVVRFTDIREGGRDESVGLATVMLVLVRSRFAG